jgi:hypothetical protein
MSKAKPDFKRMLLRLPYSGRDYAAIRFVAELAELFGVDLVGTYVEDDNLHFLTGLPNVREFRAGTWQPFTSPQLAQDTAFAAREAERLFLESVGRHRPKLSFSLAKGIDATGIEDIVAVIEPNSAIERATHQFMESLEAAFRSTSSILLVPGHANERSGPVIAVISGSSDPCLAAALAVAASGNERLILIPSQPRLSMLEVLETARVAGVTTSVSEAVFHRGNILLPAFVKGRLLVMGRKARMERPAFSQIPILLVSSELSSQADDVTRPTPKD